LQLASENFIPHTKFVSDVSVVYGQSRWKWKSRAVKEGTSSFELGEIRLLNALWSWLTDRKKAHTQELIDRHVSLVLSVNILWNSSMISQWLTVSHWLIIEEFHRMFNYLSFCFAPYAKDVIYKLLK